MSLSIVGFLFSAAKLLLPLITDWIREAQRRGLVNEGEQKLLGKQALILASDLGAWDDSQARVKNMSDADLDDLLSGVRRTRGKVGPGDGKGQV